MHHDTAEPRPVAPGGPQTLRRRLSGVLVAALLLVPTAPSAVGAAPREVDTACPPDHVGSQPFADVGSANVHAGAIACAVWWGVLAGRSASSYAPDRRLTRGQMATALARTVEEAGGDLPADPPDAFDDDDGNVHEPGIDAMAALGVVLGTGDRRYEPGRPVSRGQLATMLVRVVERLGGPLPDGPDAFGDDDGLVHEPNIDKAAAAGITAGVAADRFAPSADVRRDALASFLARSLDVLVAGGHADLPDLPDVALTTVATFTSPVDLAVRPGHDGTLYVAERPGLVQVLRRGAIDPTPLLDITGQVSTSGEGGLLGIAVSPDGGHLYVSHTDPAGDSVLAEYALGPGDDDLDVGSRRVVLTVDQPYDNHNGGDLAFDADGNLLYALGDGGGAGDPEENGQDTGTLLGSILRISPRPSGGQPYGIPEANPFASGGGRPEIVIWGVRNPWRISIDEATGDLWVADVGQSRSEEVNLLPADRWPLGVNLGWNRMEGSLPYEGSAPAEHTLPVFEYENTGDRCSITGGHVYRGSAIPALRGAYVFGDFCDGRVRGLRVAGGRVLGEHDLGAAVDGNTLVSFGKDAAGELYVLTLAGRLARLGPA